jgi:hypothetical protein
MIFLPGKSFKNLTFRDFIASTEDPRWLAGAFVFCYERPASTDDVIADSEKERYGDDVTLEQIKQAVCDERAEKAFEWYTFLTSLYPYVSGTMFQLTSIKITTTTATSAEVSFFATNPVKAKYKLNRNSYKNISLDDSMVFGNAQVKFTLEGLVPNETNTLRIEVSNVSDKTISSVVTFTTPQDFPESVEQVLLSRGDKKVPNETFHLHVTPKHPSFGYWKNGKNYGYTIQLIVNGRVKDTVDLTVLPDTIKIKELFEYEIKIGEVVQIGVRTWVKYNGKKLYDSDYAKVSNAIPMLIQPLTMYLNDK